MSYDTKKDTITVNDVTYDVERGDRNGATILTIEEFPGLEGILGYEEDAEFSNPRDWSNVGTMAVHYQRYNLGDEDIRQINFQTNCGNCQGEGTTAGNPDDGEDDEIDCTVCDGMGTVNLDPVLYFKQEHGSRVVLPLSVYEHSGITMFVGHQDYTFDPGGWDTSYVGFIYDTPENVKQCIGDNATDEQIEEALRGEVKVYASYLEGDVTCWVVEDDESNFFDGCGGYVGDSDTCESECFAQMEQAIIKRLAENKERADMAARDIITKD
jgi:hypothetical protein